MKIQRIALHNFSSHRQTDLELSTPISIIVGPLNAGKTSLKDAIEYALTGECGYYRKRTEDRSELIHDISMNGAGFTVAVQTDKGHARRTRSASTPEVFEWNQAATPTQATVLEEQLGVTRTILSAVLNTQHFFDQDATTQKELILRLLGAEVTDAKVRALFTGEPEALRHLTGQLNSLQAIANAHQYCYERRTLVRRELKELKPPDPPDGPRPPIDKIKALLNQLDTEIQQKIAEASRVETQNEGAATLLPRLKAQAAALEAKLTPEPAADIEAKLLQAVNNLRTVRDKATKDTIRLQAQVTESMAGIKLRERNIALLSKFDGRCVAGDHACPAPPADMKAALAAQKKALSEAVDSHDELNRQYEAARTASNEMTSIYKAEEALQAWRNARDQHRTAKTNYDAIQAQIAQHEAAAGEPVDVAPIREAIESLRQRIAKGKQQLEEAAIWLERDRQIQTVAARRKDLEIELRHLEELVEFLGPKGVKVQLIDERLGKFESAMNRYLEKFGFAMKIQVEPWKILGRGRPLNRLSRSERFRLGIVFQIAIAKMTGLNFLIADDTELLTPDVFGSMIGILLGSGLDQVILLKTLMTPEAEFRKAIPAMPEVEFFMVKNRDGVSQVEKVVQ